MINLRNLICEIIAERMNYVDLMRSSDPARKDRANRIPAKSLVVKSLNDKEAWKFSYKTPSDENTTGLRHQGFIYFFKDNISTGDNAMTIDCSVDCSCPDYKYRFSYANKQQDAGENGPSSLNKGLNYPSSINRGPGLCKHLISLKEFLKTNIESEPVDEPIVPTSQEKPAKKTTMVPKSPPAEKMPPEEPEPEDVSLDDPTQSPDDREKINLNNPEDNVENDTDRDPTQTPQEPEETDDTSDGDPDKLKLKEGSFDKSKIVDSLNTFCKTHKMFVL